MQNWVNWIIISIMPINYAKVLMAVLASVVITSGEVHAQLREMIISPIENPSGGIPVFTNHPDQAYLIIESPISNLVFSSNMEGIVEDQSDPDRGRYVLIIRPFTQIFTVNAPGYMSGRFRIQTPRPRTTYHFSVRPVDTATELLPVNFIVDQPGAVLFIDDQQVPIGQTVRLEPGPQQLRIENPGFRTITEQIVVSADNTLFQYQLQELIELPVTIRSEPPGATVYINTLLRDRPTNYQDFFYPGEYLVRLTMSGYRDAEKQITVSEEGPNDFMLVLERFAGTLSLTVDPPQSRVMIGSTDYTGVSSIDLSPGMHRLVVQREGYHDHEERIQVQEGQPLERRVVLRPRTGVLVFSIAQSDAQLRLFNQSGEMVAEWLGINRLPDLPVGLYQYTANLAGYPTLTGQVAIRDGTTERVHVDFSSPPVEDQVFAGQEQPPSQIPASTDRSVPDPQTASATTGMTSPPVSMSSSQGPSRSRAMLMTAVLPGSGHIYSDRKRGYFYAAAFLGVAAGSYLNWQRYQDLNKDIDDALAAYRAAQINYNNATSIEDAARFRDEMHDLSFNQIPRLGGERESTYGVYQMWVSGAALVYTVTMVDMLFSRSGYARSRQGWSVQAIPDGSGNFGAAVTWRKRL